MVGLAWMQMSFERSGSSLVNLCGTSPAGLSVRALRERRGAVAVGLNTCSFAGERLFALPRGCAEKWRLRVLATQHLSAHHRDIRGLRAAFGHDSCLQSTFEGESRLTAAAGEVS